MNRTHKLIAMCCRPFNVLLAALAFLVVPSLGEAQAQTDHPLNFAGDFRVRHERTTKQEPGATPDVRDPRNREVVRFRFGINRRINGLFNFGARLATGSPDDPNTTDITLGDFVNDLTISLDRAYMELAYKNLFITGGKFANPFRTTELLWDGDVNLQGFGASYTFSGSKTIIPKLTGVYYIVDEQTSRGDSYMGGGQLQFSINASENLSLTLAGAYYDYEIKSLVNANAADNITSNFLNATGDAYLSDFDLIDAVATIDYRGFGEQYPLRIVGDFVKNNGAVQGEDTGFGIDLYLGKVAKKKDWRFQYGYTLAENDAVLAAFSHDNTTLPTNYEQHTLGIDYVAVENTILNLTFYHYRRHNLKSANPIDNDFFSRLRLNALVNF
ncbi:putative porin [candidate division KSB1 bacterium]|nr:putative porin [candidate division KSB1 bacterium]